MKGAGNPFLFFECAKVIRISEDELVDSWKTKGKKDNHTVKDG